MQKAVEANSKQAQRALDEAKAKSAAELRKVGSYLCGTQGQRGQWTRGGHGARQCFEVGAHARAESPHTIPLLPQAPPMPAQVQQEADKLCEALAGAQQQEADAQTALGQERSRAAAALQEALRGAEERAAAVAAALEAKEVGGL